MATEPIECQILVLRVSIHCEGCKKKVKKVLQNVHGVVRCDIDARSNKVVVTASTKLDPNILVAKLRKSGKQAEPWPEQPVPPQQPPAESQSQEAKNPNDDDQSKPTEKPGPDSSEAAEPSNPQPSPEPDAGETPKPAQQESKEASNANNTGDNADDEAAAAAGQQQPNEAKRKAKQQQQPEERQPVDARVTVEYDRGGDNGYMMNRMPAPQPIMSYNMARPSTSASYYAAPPAPAPMPMARPGPSQGYIDEHYTPSYYGRSSQYEQPYYYPPQPSPYRYDYDHYQPAASTEDYYHYSAPPQRSAFSPPRDGYGDMFNDENANSCAVM